MDQHACSVRQVCHCQRNPAFPTTGGFPVALHRFFTISPLVGYLHSGVSKDTGGAQRPLYGVGVPYIQPIGRCVSISTPCWRMPCLAAG